MTSITCRHSVERDLLERPHLERRVQAGVVDEDVDRPAALDDLVGQALDVVLVGDVDGEPDAVRERRGGLVGSVQVGDDDARACGGQSFGDRAADALRRAGDDGDLAVEGSHQRIGEKEVGMRMRFCWVWSSGWSRARKSFHASSAWSFARRSRRSS